jgi:hypothetical protein
MTRITLNFTPPTQRADDTALPAGEIASYQLRRSVSAGGTFSLYNVFPVGTPVGFDMAPTDTVFFWSLATVDSAGRVSELTPPLQIPYQAPPVVANPKPPSNVAVAYS